MPVFDFLNNVHDQSATLKVMAKGNLVFRVEGLLLKAEQIEVLKAKSDTFASGLNKRSQRTMSPPAAQGDLKRQKQSKDKER